jgi:2-polyprenyl-3-methyl-5-hydroxy-6-metoxy-1,4-benzoquinol methylase
MALCSEPLAAPNGSCKALMLQPPELRTRVAHAGIHFRLGDIAAPLQNMGFLSNYFDVVISTEVIEHVYSPRALVANTFGLLRPGGEFIVTTPYHGYFKNLVLALSSCFDAHFTALWDGGPSNFGHGGHSRHYSQKQDFRPFGSTVQAGSECKKTRAILNGHG